MFTNMLRANPLMMTALDHLREMGGKAPADNWFDTHEELRYLAPTERGRIIRKLHDAGFIAKVGFINRYHTSKSGKKCGKKVNIWQVR